MTQDFGDSTAFAFQLLGDLYGRSERQIKAVDCEKKALKLNPFLWKTFESLCSRGEFVDPAKVFNVSGLDNFNQCHGVNNILSVVNKVPPTSQSVSKAVTETAEKNPLLTLTTSTPNVVHTPLQQTSICVTPLNAVDTPGSDAVPMDTIDSSFGTQ